MRINPNYKAYGRYTTNGQLVPGSVVWRKRPPKTSGQNGIWREIPGQLCCTTTSTTSTSTTTTTTTTTTGP